VNETIGVPELLDRLRESMLLSAEEMERAVTVAGSAAADGRSLARALVAAGLLTAYQAEAVCQGKYAELRIGNYEVLDRLGAGGMGTVFKARHRRMKRIVALKVLSRSLAKDDTFVRRFQREVETIARLAHPNIVMAHDADEDDAGPFLVMEYVSGQDLASLVQQGGPLAVRAAVRGIVQAARGLEYAHGQGIIHRDVKPANLLCDAAGIVKVTDLGLARLNNPGALEGITQAGGVMGTVDYMSPEQAVDSTRIDHRADVYSLGASLYFVLTGKPVYQGQTMMATLLQHRDAPIPSLVAARPDVPAALDTAYRRMLAKAPADRFQTMTEVVRALEIVEAGLGETSVGEAGPGGITLIDKIVSPLPEPGSTDAAAAGATGAWTKLETEMPAPLASALEGNSPSPPVGVPMRVVLVEPSRTQSGIIRRYLQAQGVPHVVAVASGQEALKEVRRARPDAIVSALHLPDMTGVQLAQQISAESTKAAPGFVLISSEAENSETGSLSKCGRAVVLQKPFTPEKLVAALRMASGAPPARSTATDRGKLRVLIVDDSAAARMHVRNVLKGLGLSQFVEAPDGARAVTAVAKEPFDLIVTDYNMPFMDGRGLIAYLKENPATASIPIIMVTTEADPAKIAAVRQLDVAAICDKSFPPEVVGKIIDQLERTP
jgi:CheY-like chemotaxis protein/tRNA A-37 threonylcarbamoyl transferase component Bud32